MFAIEQLLAQLGNDKNRALDFGCGSGDFIGLLGKYYKEVVGYDVSEVMIEKVNMEFIDYPFVYPTSQLSSINSYTYNIILSVTVLQTFCKEELNSTMNMFFATTGTNGCIIAM